MVTIQRHRRFRGRWYGERVRTRTPISSTNAPSSPQVSLIQRPQDGHRCVPGSGDLVPYRPCYGIRRPRRHCQRPRPESRRSRRWRPSKAAECPARTRPRPHGSRWRRGTAWACHGGRRRGGSRTARAPLNRSSLHAALCHTGANGSHDARPAQTIGGPSRVVRETGQRARQARQRSPPSRRELNTCFTRRRLHVKGHGAWEA